MAAGRTRSLGIGYPAYEEARGLAGETARLGTEAMVQLALAMERFMDRWLAASGRLGGPRFSLG